MTKNSPSLSIPRASLPILFEGQITRRPPLTWRRALIITHRVPRRAWAVPTLKPATGKKERGGKVVCQVSKAVTAILAQLAQEFPQLRGSVIRQLGYLGREFASRSVGERFVALVQCNSEI